jgi:pimeloyl-ACP methyl ester carboxylesterase
MPYFTLNDGAELFYRAAGEGEHHAVFVHPFMHNSTLWLDPLRDLKDIRRCIAVDLRGHGRSDPNPNPSIVDTEHVADLVALIDTLPGQIDLVGLAYGGNMCALVYEQRPERIRSLTLISSTFNAMDAVTRRYTSELGRMAVIEGKGVVFRKWLEYIVAPSATLFAKARYRSIVETTPTETMVAFLCNGQITPRPDLPAKIKVPVLIPFGQYEPSGALEATLKDIPNLRFEPVPNAGRLLPIEAPAPFSALLRDFWTSIT